MSNFINKKNTFKFIVLLISGSLIACQPVQPAAVKKAADDYLGDYTGQLSCVSCLHTTTDLKLNKDLTYQLKMVMIEGENRYPIADNSGSFSKNEQGIISLNEDKMYFSILDNNDLQIVDETGKPFPTVEGRICSLKKKAH